MARIVFDARMVGPRMHGIARHAYHLIRELARQEPRHEWIALASSGFLRAHLEPLGVRVLETDLALYGLTEIWRLPRLLARLGADLHYSPTYFAPPLAPCPHVQTIHDLTHLWRGRRSGRFRAYFDLVVGSGLRRAARVVTLTRFVAGQIRRYFRLPEDRIAVIPSGTGLDAPLPPAGGPRRSEVLCLVNEKRHKNAAGAVRAVELLRARGHPEVRLVLVGPLAPALERRLIGHAGVERQLFLEEPALVERLARACAFLFPSYSEGWGHPPLEAMLAGTPVVSSNATCLPEVLGDAALYADPARPDEMAAQLARVLADPALAADLAARGLAHAARYRWDEMARRIRGVIDRALGSG